jgi:hypothetical protein
MKPRNFHTPAKLSPHSTALPFSIKTPCILAGHVMDQTLDGYLHLAAPNAMRAVVRSLLKIYDIMPTQQYNNLLARLKIKYCIPR